ncbi:MAG TPA: hypothetical protein VE954_04885 [Oligoflexus sp.]|uniref:hypothetical protein n=1 Tax=Oligoflexus sp. TaxID=1971216 RepID=UPI002D476DC7|nr:hypothetical protein [Oligoflexus sp.]HYX32427.1 hypothetical protein [Oligoflexus sp.]
MNGRHFRIVLSLIFLQACQPAEPRLSQLKEDPKDLQGEIPGEGRSLFDQMTMVRQGDRFIQEIPFPLEALRARLESRLETPMVATLVPKGRSLQRHATQEPFRYPRVVMAAVSEGKGTADDLGFQVKDRLYVGYVEAANQLEAISYNPDMGRFEFQIIDNYGPGLEPRVRYASRPFCLACHQNESPIFSNPGWDETAANPKIQEQLVKAIKSDRYLGIPIRQLPTIPNAIDDATDRANLLIPYQKLWSLGCDDAHCRRLSLELALTWRLFDRFDDELYIQAKAAYEKAWVRSFPEGLAIPQNNIPNFDPFKDFATGKDTSFLNHLGVDVKGSLEQLADDKDIPAEVEPLQERKDPLETWTLENEDAARLIFGIAGEFQEADLTWLRRSIKSSEDLKNTLDLIEVKASPLFKQSTFTRCRTLNAFATALQTKLPNCDLRAFAAMPPAYSTGKDANQGEQKDERLVLLRRYCSQCHGSGPLNFLEGDDRTVVSKLSQSGTSHIERLSWETTRSRTMPPANSNPRKAVEARPEDRRKMIEILKQVTGTP